MKGPLDVHRTLLGAGVQHEIVRVPRPLNAADDMPDVLSLPSKACVSVRLYESGGALFALAVPAGSVLRSAGLARALGVPTLSPAPVHRVNAVTDFTAALVSPICLPPQVTLVVDAVLGLSHVLYTPTGDSGTVLKIHSRDLLIHTGAMVAALTGPVALPDDMPLHIDAHSTRFAVAPMRVASRVR